MAITPFMNLDLPTVSVTLGPEWASDLNAALDLVDSHDHSDGKGTRIKTAGLDINADLTFNSFSVFGLKSVRLAEQLAALTGSANALSLFSLGGDLYYTSGGGTAIQLTAGASIVSTPSAVETFPYNPLSADIILTSLSTEVILGVDTTAARSITLPAASAVSAGRVFVVKDLSGLSETNAITVLPTGADVIDGELSTSVRSNYASVMYVTNGIDRWFAI